MNGKRAKKLRKMAALIVVKTMKAKLSDGYNEYNHAMNRIDWEPQLDSKGFPMKDPDGVGLMKPGKFPGTLTCAWKWRVLYKMMKHQWMSGPKGGKHNVVG
jgi:hypothetical protein